MSRMIIFVAIFLVSLTVVACDCPPGTYVGPCLCMEDSNGYTALHCTEVADGNELANVFTSINVTYLSSVEVLRSPSLASLPDSLFGPVTVAAFSLQNTGLTSLDNSVFSSPTADNLETLYIKRNPSFATFDGSLIDGLSQLGELYVSFDSLSSLGGQLPDTGAYYLDFSNNGLNEIPPNFFSKAFNASIVLLGFNNLTSSSLTTDTLNFSYTGDNLFLYLGYNALDSGVSLDAFSGQIPNKLILSGNGITTFSSDAFSPLLDAMYAAYSGQGYMLMDNNPITCDCSIEWLVTATTKSLVQEATCSDGRLVSNLTPADFSGC